MDPLSQCLPCPLLGDSKGAALMLIRVGSELNVVKITIIKGKCVSNDLSQRTIINLKTPCNL